MPLVPGQPLVLPPGAARHAQVLRLQPGHAVTLFNGSGGEFDAVIERMGRSDVQVVVGTHHAVERENGREVHLALVMPANERMDWLVEKATELGVSSLQPLVGAHSVLRLQGERAARKQAHWQGIAVAACEQCGRNRIPPVHEVRDCGQWLAQRPPQSGLLLSLRPDSVPVLAGAPGAVAVVVLSGPEGGLSGQEEALALASGFIAASLGPRVMRAETAPLAALVLLAAAP